MDTTYIRNVDGKWYAFAQGDDKWQVLSIGADNPPTGRWYASRTDAGIRYVATPSPNRKAAVSKARRNGCYAGEI